LVTRRKSSEVPQRNLITANVLTQVGRFHFDIMASSRHSLAANVTPPFS
jgi:hypothetical protein